MRFPVITMKDNVVSFKRSQDELGKCTPTAFRKGWFKDLRILDSDGCEYTVTDAGNPRDTGKKLYSGWFAPKVIKEIGRASCRERV